MEKLSYRLKSLAIYIFILTLIGVLIYNLLSTFGTTNVGTISKENFKNKSFEREAYFNDFFYPYITTIKSLQQSEIIKQYFSQDISKDILQNYFLDLKKSLPCLTQVRFIDENGMEQIRVDGTPVGLFKDKAISKITPTHKLQNKSHTEYVQKFLTLKKGELGLSKLELNKEYGKIVSPKKPTLRIGMGVYDELGEKQGILVFSLCLRTFFKLLDKTTLYHVYLIDDQGKFINHYNSDFGLLGKKPEYSINDQFPNDAKEVLSNNEYFGNSFYATTLKEFSNGQNLRLILELKFSQELQKTKQTKENFIFFSFLLALLLLGLIIYFAKLPDILKQQALKEKLISKLTKLPNRLSLMEDLANKQFTNSLIILISANNMLRIQNTYGYEISNNLVKQVANYLELYENGIETVYANSYNIFCLKYKYTDQATLEKFLKEIIYDIEHHSFTINLDENEVEFTIETTFGVSNPTIINNSIEELNEAENALEYALDHKKQIKIFSHSFHENIQENKENLLLAKKIKKAIERDKVFLHFQPIFNNFTEKIEKYESLIRMECEDQLIFPDRFLPIAKQINKYNTLSYIVIEKAFEYFQDKELEFSINISILDIENPEFQEYLFESLNRYNIGNKLVLEIVEQEGVENYDDFFKFIKKVKEHNCQIAIDDFGSGYSNYELIIQASDYIDYLKLDGSLIKNLPKDPKIQILVGSLKFLCDNLGIKTIAEYVEDEEVLKYIQSIGIDYSQGYYIGKPSDKILENG